MFTLTTCTTKIYITINENSMQNISIVSASSIICEHFFIQHTKTFIDNNISTI